MLIIQMVSLFDLINFLKATKDSKKNNFELQNSESKRLKRTQIF